MYIEMGVLSNVYTLDSIFVLLRFQEPQKRARVDVQLKRNGFVFLPETLSCKLSVLIMFMVIIIMIIIIILSLCIFLAKGKWAVFDGL